jgi:hypothetical protein
MAAQILVALKSEDRLGQMIPYIEKIARPGMRVVILIRFIPHPASQPSRHDWMESEYPGQSRFIEEESKKSRFPGASIRGTRSIEEQTLAAEHKVFLALEALLRRGIEITVDVYTGSLRRVVKSYTCKGNVHFIMKRLGKVRAMMQFVRMTLPTFGWFKQRTFSPVLLQQMQLQTRGA